MKIAMLANSISGGMWNHSLYLSEKLSGLGHDVEILSRRHPAMGFTHRKMKAVKIYAYEYFYRKSHILRTIRDTGPDVVHTHHQSFNLDFYLKKIRRLCFPLVSTLHVAPSQNSRIDRLVNRYFNRTVKGLSNADQVIVVSKFMKKAFEDLGLSRINVIYNGVDRELFYPEENAREILGFPKDRFCMLYAGRLSPEKGITMALKAAKRIGNANLYVIGSGFMKAAVKHYSRKYDNIFYIGKVSNELLRMYYSASDVVLFPSIWQEAFGMVMTEGMSCGTPAIAFDVGAIPEIIVPGKNGFIAREKTSLGLEKAIRHVMDNPFPRGTERFCQDFVEKNFSWEEVARQTEKVYRRAVS